MKLQMKPLTLDLDRLQGLSPRLITSHHENNYGGAVNRLGAIRQQLAELDWPSAPVFVVNGLKREELVAANSACLHELYFDALGGDGVLPSNGFSVALTREGRLINHWAADHTQLLAGASPVLALDMYEHAYHLDFGAKAGAYVDAFMQNIRWDAVYRRYGAAVAGDAVALGVGVAALAGATQGVVDVRRAEDYAAAPDMLAGARWCDPAQVDSWSPELDAKQPVFVYCMKGLDIGRSTALSLRARGFDVRYLAGGIDAWKAAGLTLQARSTTPGASS